MIDLADRLEELAESARSGGDWGDVERRAALSLDRGAAQGRTFPRKRRSWRLAVAIAVGVGIIGVVPALGVPGVFDGWLSTSTSRDRLPAGPSSPEPAPVAFISGSTLFPEGEGGPSIGLKRPLSAPLMGPEEKIAAASPDGRFVIYHAWSRDKVPSLRVVDLGSGRDRLLVRGAQSIAWRADGALAYVQGFPPAYRPGARGPGWAGHVMVRDSLDAPPVRWTKERGQYTVVGWAGTRLAVESRGDGADLSVGNEPKGALVFSSPGRYLGLGDDQVVAISPDGRFLLNAVDVSSSTSDVVRVVSARTGRTLSRLHQRIYGRGSWVGTTAVAPGARSEKGGDLALMSIEEGQLRLARVLTIDGSGGLGSRHGVSLSNPRFVGSGAHTVVAMAHLPVSGGGTYFLTCDVLTRKCVRGSRVDPRVGAALVIRAPH